MADREKVFDAIRNCVTEPKCKDCPWEDCEKIGCKRTKVPVTLLLDTLTVLKEQEVVVRCKDCTYLNVDTGICIVGIPHGYKDTFYCAYGKRRVKQDG